MDFSYSEEQRQLQDSIVRFLDDRYDIESRRALINSDLGHSDENWSQFAELGLLGVAFDAEDGGYGYGSVGLMLVMEAFGRALVVEPYWSTVAFAGGALRQDARSDRRADLIGRISSGELKVASAYSEEAGRYHLSHVASSAEETSGGWRLSGRKSVVLGAGTADLLIVSARTSGEADDRDGITLFLVEAGASGLSLQEYRTVDGFRAAEVTLEDVEVGSDAVLGEVGGGMAVLDQAEIWGILGLGAEASGVMERAYQLTVEYTKERKQFGVPISSFQVLQHRMVDMFIETEQTKSLVLMLALALQTGENTAQAASALKIQVGKAGRYNRPAGDPIARRHGHDR